MPDRVRYRADGSNEVGAIKPDIAAYIRQYETPRQKRGSCAVQNRTFITIC